MGTTVVGGAITSIGSAVPLLFAQLAVFHKFGIFIISFVTFSVLLSLFLFGSLVHLAGPTGNIGKLKNILCCSRNDRAYEEDVYPDHKQRKVNKTRKVETI